MLGKGGGKGEGAGGAYAAQKMFRMFSSILNVFLACIRERGGGLAQGATHAKKILDNS